MTKKKTLLKEGTVRQFMKLANLQPLASDFVETLYEKKQGYDARLDDTLGAKDGAEKTKKQSLKDREHESEGEEEAHGKHKYASDKEMSEKKNPYGGEKGGREHDAPEDEHEDKETEEEEDKADYEKPTSRRGKKDKEKAEKARVDELGPMMAATLGGVAGKALGQRDDEGFEEEVEEDVDIHSLVSAITRAIEDETGVEISVSADEEVDLDDEHDDDELEDAEHDEEHADDLDVDAEEDLGDLEEMVTTIAENVTKRLQAMAKRKK